MPTVDKPAQIPAVQYRTAQFERAGINTSKREITLSLSSEEPVRAFGVEEILDHGERSVRLGRLRKAGTFLWNHDRNAVIGRIMSAKLEEGRLVATVRFATNALAEEKWRDVEAGILAETSIGYRVHDAVLEKPGVEVDTFRVTDWEPFEGSLVSIPADCSVGVGRSATAPEESAPFVLPAPSTHAAPNHEDHFRTMSTEAPAAPPAKDEKIVTFEETRRQVESARSEAVTAERRRQNEIESIADRLKDRLPGVADAARSAVREGKSVEDFQRWVLEDGFKARPVDSTAPSLSEMQRDAKRAYSLCRVIRSQDPELSKTVDIGFEREVSQALRTAAVGKTRKSDFTVPSEVFGIGIRQVNYNGRRDMLATTPTSGGYTVATDLQEGIIELLDNMLIMGRIGVRRLTGLQGNVTIARQTGGATAYWVAENAALTDSDLAFDLVALTPKTIGATTPVSKQLIVQSSSDIESFVRRDLQLRLALGEELAFFQGTGGGQPLGIFNQVIATTEGTTEAGKVTKVTYGAAATFADAVGIVGDLLEAKVPLTNFAHIISPASWAKWATKSIDTGSGRFIWEGRADGGTVGGYPGYVSQHLPSEKSVSGAWDNAIWAQWGGVDIVVDPYVLKKQQALEVTVYDMVDFAFRHLEAFACSTDSAAQ